MFGIFKPHVVRFRIGRQYKCKYHCGDGQWKEAVATVLDTAPYGVYFNIPGLTGLSTYPFTPRAIEYDSTNARYQFAFLDRWSGFSCCAKDIVQEEQKVDPDQENSLDSFT